MADKKPRPWTKREEQLGSVAIKLMSAANTWAFRMSGGRLGARFPGGAPVPMSYDAWRALLWGPTALTNSAASDPASDADGDGLSNYAEYALGLHPRRNQPTKRPQAFLEESGGQRYLVIQFTASSAAIGASFGFEVSSNLLNWSSPALPLDLLWSQPNIEGTVLRRYREPLPLEPSAQHFLRLKVTAP